MTPRRLDIFGIDLRSLALFRIGLGAFVLLDLLNRAADLTAHYTWDGVITEATLKEAGGMLRFLMPHYYCSASAVLQAGLFFVHGAVAVVLIAGYRTRIVTVACWYLTSSLQLCNTSLWYGADDVVRLCLFWGMFLPLGARFSLDRAAAPPSHESGDTVVSVASLAYLVQVCLIYFCAAMFKLNSDHWWEGDALRYALHYDWYVTGLGIWMREQAWMIPWLTWGTILVEGMTPFLILAPVGNGPLRLVATVALVGLHVGFILTMAIIFFPYASLVCLLPLIPTWFWCHLFRRWRTPKRLGLRIYFDGQCTFCRRMVRLIQTFTLLPETSVVAATPGSDEHAHMTEARSWVVVDAQGRRHLRFDAFVTLIGHSPWAAWAAWPLRLTPICVIGDGVYRWVAAHRSLLAPWSEPLAERALRITPRRITQVFVACALVLMLALSLRTFKVQIPSFPVDPLARVLRLGPQNWSMFGMGKVVADHWVVMPARLADGTEVDVFRDGAPVDWKKPAKMRAIYPSYRWMQYLHFRPKWKLYADYVQRDWNDRHPPSRRIDRLKIYYMVEVTGPDHIAAPTPKLQYHTAKSVGGTGRRR